jgi:hypothetical protein
MNTVDVINDVRSRFSTVVGVNLIKSQINSIIDRINVEMGSRVALITVISEEGTTFLDTDVSFLDTDVGFLDGNVYDGFSYDSTEYSITLSDAVEKIEKLWVDNEEWLSRTYQEIKATGNSSSEIFYSAGRKIYFPSDVSDKVIKLQVRMCYGYLTDEVITLPDNYKQLIVSGCIYMLSSLPEYENKTLISVHKEIYDIHIFELRNKKNMIEINQDTVRDYDYQGIQAGRV